MQNSDLELAEGWQSAPPVASAPPLLIEAEGRLLNVQSDFRMLYDFGPVGPVDCPIAWDADGAVAYRHVCENRLFRSDFSQIREYSLATGRTRVVKNLGVNQWVLWFLEWMPGRGGSDGGLFGLLASDVPVDEGIRIHHQLFLLDGADWRLKTRMLCRDAYYPIAFNREREEMIFTGAEGIYRVGFRGKRISALAGSVIPRGRGGDYDPTGAPRAAIGGGGLFLWNFDSGNCTRLARLGQYPVWSPDGKGIWYSESSSNLKFYDLERDEPLSVLSIRRDRHPEVSFSRKPKFSVCGRYLALPVTSRRIAGLSADPAAPARRERSYRFEHRFCILDMQERLVWQRPGFVPNFCWLG